MERPDLTGADVKIVRGELPTQDMRNYERDLKKQLMELQRQYQRAAEPILKSLERLEVHRPHVVMIMAPAEPEG